MTSWTNATGPTPARDPGGPSATGPPPHLWRAVVRPERLEQDVERTVLPGTGALAAWVEQVWSLAWRVPLPATTSTVITHPTVHLTLEAGPAGEVRHGHALPAALLHGVVLERFGLPLPAHGWVVGLHLAPGAIADLTGTPAHTWTSRVLPWGSAWPGWPLRPVWEADGTAARAEALLAVAARVIGSREPSPDAVLARRVETLVRTDRSLRSVEALAAAHDVSVRHLQRVSRHHLGVTPRWLLRRARVLDAHDLLTSTDLSVADVAARLGWYDQAHLTRDYTRVTGVPPVRLRRERRPR